MMNTIESSKSVNSKYVLATLSAVMLTWFLHEFAHWLTGELLGYNMIMTLNTCYPINDTYAQNWHQHIISAAGPIITMIEALAAYLLLKRDHSHFLFPFLLTCFYMRLVAGGISVINPNDEARISQSLGIGTFTLPIIVSAILFYLVFRTVKTRGFTTKQIAITIVLIMLFSSAIILADQAWKVRVL
jgi:hypothetical protein